MNQAKVIKTMKEVYGNIYQAFEHYNLEEVKEYASLMTLYLMDAHPSEAKKCKAFMTACKYVVVSQEEVSENAHA